MLTLWGEDRLRAGGSDTRTRVDGEPLGQGAPFPDTVVHVAEEMTDRGFWIEDSGRRMLAVVIDEPAEEPIDINPGQRLEISGGTLRSPDYLSEMPGVPLDADTEAMARQQEIFLVVDERNLDILPEAL